jgi:arylsulfatase A
MLRLILTLTAFILLCGSVRADDRPPNVVIIFTDDQGYGDVGSFGGTRVKTPNLDRMAREGVRGTDFHVPQAVCSASRAALLTGCYPNRIGILGALGPRNTHGIHERETTLAEVLKPRGYATAIFGKWHLGHQPQFLPTRHGFDEYYGLPYSNDMLPRDGRQDYPPLPLIDGDKIIAHMPDQTQLTRTYTERAVQFIARNKSRPFFLYVPHSMPHVPLHTSERFRGKTPDYPYADVIAEIDWSVGEILTALKQHGLDGNTLVIFTTDNGPWLNHGNHAGSAGGFREGKGTSFEGGVRVPFIARWSGKMPAGKVCAMPFMTIDLLPTIAKLAGAELPKLPIDGVDVWPWLIGNGPGHDPHEALYFYWDRELQAVRSGKWKLHFPHTYRGLTGTPGKDGKPNGYTQQKIGLALFDLVNDPGEKTDVAAQHPDVLQRLQALAEKARDDLGDTATKKKGNGVREPGKVE